MLARLGNEEERGFDIPDIGDRSSVLDEEQQDRRFGEEKLGSRSIEKLL